jgi:basic amino acid/polyamine antiporter, APA family
LAPLGFLADLVSIGTLFAFIVVSVAVWMLRITDPDMPRPFRAPMVPLVATLSILVNGYMMFHLGPENWLRLLIWLVLGLLIYFGYSRHHSALRGRTLDPDRRP